MNKLLPFGFILAISLAACGGGATPVTPVVPVATPTPDASHAINGGSYCVEIAQAGQPAPGLYPEVSFAVTNASGDLLTAYSTNPNIAIVQFSGSSGGIWGTGFGQAQINIVDSKLNTVTTYYTVTVKAPHQC